MASYNGITNILFGSLNTITTYTAISPTTSYLGMYNSVLKDFYDTEYTNVVFMPPIPHIKQVGQVYIKIGGRSRYDSI